MPTAFAAIAASLLFAVAHTAWAQESCRQGYVWREAAADDYVCVRPEVRAQAAYDNAQSASRRRAGGGGFGPNTCRTGFVWREAFPGDVVCVTPDTRTRAAKDNAAAAIRTAR
jgi:hypothetical protein